MAASLPKPPASFVARRDKILEGLAVPDEEYADLSPKGSVDVGIRELIREINSRKGLVTMSSCAGRVSIFVEGKKKQNQRTVAGGRRAGEGEEEGSDDDGEETGDFEGRKTLAAVGGKGGGGTWLFVSHDPVEKGKDKNWRDVLGVQGKETGTCVPATGDERLVHFKFEPMILHILTASPAHAQLTLRAALQAGFRESGSINITPIRITTPATPIVAVRSMGLSFESLLGHRDPTGNTTLYVPESYLDIVMKLANERFVENTRRIERFREEMDKAFRVEVKMGDLGVWEDKEVRRARKREEGLRRSKEKEEAAAAAKAQEVEIPDFNKL